GDGDCTDLCLFLDETGYVAAPGPFFATVALAAPLLAAAGDPRVDAVLAGDATATVAIAGAAGVWEPNAEARKLVVPDADRAHLIVVVGPAWTVQVAARDECTIAGIDTMDFSR